MLLSLMYHHCNSDEFSNSKEMLEEHFEFISKNYRSIFCGERFSIFRTDILLVFDDGFFDFYYYVYPLLKKYNLKAVLSIPTKYILEDTDIEDEKRLSIKHSDMIYNPDVIKYAPFCTWKEIQEMSKSGYVEIASHSINHPNLTKLSLDEVEKEIKVSKDIIESKIDKKVDTFVYPYGAYNEEIREIVKKYYKYDIGIGDKYNFSWDNTINRLYADDLESCCGILDDKQKIKYFAKAVIPNNLKKVIKWIIRKN